MTPDWGLSYFHVHPVSGRHSCRNYRPRGEHEKCTAVCTLRHGMPWVYVISIHNLSYPPFIADISLPCKHSTCFHIETRDWSWTYCNRSMQHACNIPWTAKLFWKVAQPTQPTDVFVLPAFYWPKLLSFHRVQKSAREKKPTSTTSKESIPWSLASPAPLWRCKEPSVSFVRATYNYHRLP